MDYKNKAVIRVLKLLEPGLWVKSLTVRRMLDGSGVGFVSLGEALQIAESDRGQYICLPKDQTPELAPDELKIVEVQLYQLLESAAA